MADDLDRTQERLEAESDIKAAHYAKLVASMPKGEAGECELCGEHSLRLVNKACAPCRDKYKLP